MSQTTINFTWTVDGVLTDATSVKLSDPAGTYGVRRTDNNDVVVADDTAMTRDSTGTYSHTFTDPAAGLTYNYFVEVVYLGVTYRFERNLSKPPIEVVDGAYLTISEARQLIASLIAMPGMDALDAASDGDLAALLLAATIDIDSAMPYQGVRYDPGQALEFPRYANAIDRGLIRTPGEALHGAGLPGVWDWDSDANAAVVPQRVTQACVIQAASLLADPAARARLEAIRSGLASQSVGSLSESYLTSGSIPGGLTGLCDRAQRLMEHYRLRSGELL